MQSNLKEVLQYGSLAAWPYTLAEALKAVGCPSVNVIPEEIDVHDLNRKLPYHQAIIQAGSNRFIKGIARAAFLASIPKRYSLVHYHGSHLLRGTAHHLLEGRYLAACNIPMIVSFGGGDARIVEMARAKNPYFFRPSDPQRDESIKCYLKSISRYIRYVATDCEMEEYVAPYFDKVFTFRQPVELSRFSCFSPNIDRPPVFLHVPTEPYVKGTEHIVAAMDNLKAQGLDFEFRMKRRMTQQEFYKELATCDVYIDELRCGSYGVTAVEAMASGKPVITYIRPDLVARYPPNMPLVSANPDTIEAIVRDLICEPQRRVSLAVGSRAYVEQYHDAIVVAREMLSCYREIGLSVA